MRNKTPKDTETTQIALLGSVFLPPTVLEPLAAALDDEGYDVTTMAPIISGSSREVLGDYEKHVSGLRSPIIVAHSNAGNYVPALVSQTAVAGAIFMDAALPPFGGGRWPVVPDNLKRTLPTTADRSRVQRWTRWWPAEEMTRIFPSKASFCAIDSQTAEIPRPYLTQTLDADENWADDAALGYLALSDGYTQELERAAARKVPTRQLFLDHLGMMTDPALVGTALTTLVQNL
jgi:hypothetical protein